MSGDARFSPNFSSELIHPHLFTSRLVQHYASISAQLSSLLHFFGSVVVSDVAASKNANSVLLTTNFDV